VVVVAAVFAAVMAAMAVTANAMLNLDEVVTKE
jgi:hypothetical protein